MKLNRRKFIASGSILVAHSVYPSSVRTDLISSINHNDSAKATKNGDISFNPGYIFNESEMHVDVPTSRHKRRLTTRGAFNNTPYNHFNTLFTSDSRYLIFNTKRDNGSALLCAETYSGDLKVLMGSEDGRRSYYDNCHATTIPGSHQVAVLSGDQDGKNVLLSLCDIDTLDTRVLHQIPDDQYAVCPIASIDGRFIFWAQRPKLKEKVPGGKPTFDAYTAKYGGIPTTIYEMEMASGKITAIYQDPKCQTNHMHPNPANPDLILIERDQPPWYSWRGDMGKTSRVWALHRTTGALTEIRPRNRYRFHMHCSWSFDGRYVLYHSRDYDDAFEYFGKNGGRHYIGAADLHGNVAWERVFPYLYYGHVTGHTQRNSVVFDSLTTPDMICEIEFDRLAPDEQPEVKILAQHGSTLTTGSAPSHPHMLLSPDGRWMVYNWGDMERSDVYLVAL